MQRRQFLYLSGLLAQRAHAWSSEGGQGIPSLNSEGKQGTSTSEDQPSGKEFLARLIPTRQDVDDWLDGHKFPFSKYDSELGYLHRDRRFKEGMDGTICTYTYDPSGARHTIMNADMDMVCRINTYGNSFTSCEQVSDGETWQEVLAAFLGEPIRNYGIGAYSVYQAYLRMKREESRNPASYIILNIFGDDHFRNLLSYQAIGFGKIWQHFCPPLPHVVVNLATGQVVEIPNPCPTPESLYNLCDLDWVYKTFGNDFFLKRRLAREREKLPNAGGVTADPILTQAALLASTYIVNRVEEFAAANNKKVLYVLSYDPFTVIKRLQGEKRFDQTFVDFLEERKLPYVDLMEAHAADYAQFKSSAKDYVFRYYVGHYNPLGNLFCAFAMRNKLVSMLDPKPAPYSGPYQSATSS